MDRIKGAGHVNNMFVAEDAAQQRPPTEITAEWLNAVQEEIASVILSTSAKLNGGDNGQLNNAIRAIITAMVPGLVPTATESASGKIELATEAETAAGTDKSRAVHPSALKALLASFGIGTNDLADYSGDLNALTTGGFWLATGANTPTGVSAMVIVMTNATSLTIQIASPQEGGGALYCRSANSGGWSSWNQLASTNSPIFTGTPKVPTAPTGTNNTQAASTAFVQATVAALVGSSPVALDTLNELAAALGNDPNFATKITNALSNKQPIDPTLTALAALATAADKLIYATGPDTFAMTPFTALARTLLAATDQGSARAAIGAIASSDVPVILNAPGAAPLYACRAWVNFNGTGTVAIRAAGNVSSVTDNGVGDYTINFTTPLADANYSVISMARPTTAAYGQSFTTNVHQATLPTAAAVRVANTFQDDNSNSVIYVDSDVMGLAVFR